VTLSIGGGEVLSLGDGHWIYRKYNGLYGYNKYIYIGNEYTE
jgi:hypothetical protein